MTKLIEVANTEDLKKMRIENEGKYHKVLWDNKRADFYARNGVRMLTIWIKE